MSDNAGGRAPVPDPLPSEPDSPSLDRFEVTTDPLPPKERFDFFCDVIAANYLGFDAAGTPEDAFSGQMTGVVAGTALITRNATTPAQWTRTRRSADDADLVMLSFNDAGLARFRQGEADLAFTPGSVALFPTSTGRLDIVERAEGITVRLPRVAIEASLRPGLLIKAMLFAPNDPIIQLASDYVRSVARDGDALTPQAGEAIGRHLAELVALALGATRDAQATIADGGLKAARVEAILRMIERDFAAAGISPATVGAALGISDRHVHRLLEETNRTFYEHLLEARLAAAWRMLSSPAMKAHRFGEIAMLAGFGDVTYFNRVFKARFGDTPSGVRASGLWG